MNLRINDEYRVIEDLSNGVFKATRHGEEWRNLVGDNLVLSMANRIDELQNTLAQVCITLDEKSGTIDHPRTLTLEEIFEVYQLARKGLGEFK